MTPAPVFSTHSSSFEQASDAVRLRLLEAQLAAQLAETCKWRQLSRQHENRQKREHRKVVAAQREADRLRQKLTLVSQIVNEGEKQ